MITSLIRTIINFFVQLWTNVVSLVETAARHPALTLAIALPIAIAAALLILRRRASIR